MAATLIESPHGFYYGLVIDYDVVDLAGPFPTREEAEEAAARSGYSVVGEAW